MRRSILPASFWKIYILVKGQEILKHVIKYLIKITSFWKIYVFELQEELKYLIKYLIEIVGFLNKHITPYKHEQTRTNFFFFFLIIQMCSSLLTPECSRECHESTGPTSNLP